MKKLMLSELYKIKAGGYIKTILIVLIIFDTLICSTYYVKSMAGGNSWELSGAGMLISNGFKDFLFIILAAFSAFFVGKEFQERTIMLTVSRGYSKTQIYVSKLLVCILFSFFIIIFDMIVTTSYATIMWGFDKYGIFNLAGCFLYLLVSFFLIIAVESIFFAAAVILKYSGRSILFNMLFLFFGQSIFMLISWIINIDITSCWIFACFNSLSTYTPVLSDIIKSTVVGTLFIAASGAIGIMNFKRKDILV